MKRLLFIAFSILALVLRAEPLPSSLDVTTYGAKGDGVTLATQAIQQAIDVAHAKGGGTVYFPAGKYLCGSLIMKSNVTLYLSTGTVLLGSTELADYARPEDSDKKHHLIYARDAENIAIMGNGIIDGQGDVFIALGKKKEDKPSPLIKFEGTRHISIEGITIRQSPRWTLHVRDCDDVKVRGISVLNDLSAINSDGIDVDSSRNVMISDCRIESGDDCIVLKTTRIGRGVVSPPTENVVVTNCILISSTCALKVGTESYGDFRHILFSNCIIRDSRSGLSVFAKDGGTVEDVRFSNIIMTTKTKTGTCHEWPIVIDIEKRTESSRISSVRDIAFSGITIYSRGRIIVAGMPGSLVEGVRFQNVLFNVTGYEDVTTSKKVRGAVNLVAPPADYSKAPAMFIFGYVKDVSLSGITVRSPDPLKTLPLVYTDRAEEVEIKN